jgi:hypothetical protein
MVDVFLCKTCGLLDVSEFYASSVRNHLHRCKTCDTEHRRKMYGERRPLIKEASACRIRENVTLTTDDFVTVCERYKNTCVITGSKGRLTLVKADTSKPLSVDNAVPVARGLARRICYSLGPAWKAVANNHTEKLYTLGSVHPTEPLTSGVTLGNRSWQDNAR